MLNGFSDIIFFAVFAIFIAAKLFSVLGRKDFDSKDSALKNKKEIEGQIIQFPEVDNNKNKIKNLEIEDFIAEENTKEISGEHADEVRKIRAIDPRFSKDDFLKGAIKAFEMVVESFAKGDKRTLKGLLSKEVYKGFVGDIEKREKEQRVRETTIVSILSSKVKDIILHKKQARIVVEFVSQQISLSKDKNGKIIEGNPSQIDEITDIWTFARNLTSSNPNWELVETKEG